MPNHEARMWIVGGVWCTATVGIAVWSVSAGAGVSTVALAVASCAAPWSWRASSGSALRLRPWLKCCTPSTHRPPLTAERS
jgi:hypothetical protein